MEMALGAAKAIGKGGIYTEGPLIHNPQVLELLQEQGVVPLPEKKGNLQGTVIIRSHGISPKRLQELKQTGALILDATCPKVKKVQSIIERCARNGYGVVIVGDPAHAEVKGLSGFAGESGVVIQNEGELINLPSGKKLCVVAQTTQNREKFIALTEKIKERFPETDVFDTICDANRKRQEELQNLCLSVDAMVVVGGKASANTKRLVEIAQSTDTPTFFVESEADLEPDPLKQYKVVGVIGGASTPDWVLKRVVQRLSLT